MCGARALATRRGARRLSRGRYFSWPSAVGALRRRLLPPLLECRVRLRALQSPDPEPKPTNSRSAFLRGCSQREVPGWHFAFEVLSCFLIFSSTLLSFQYALGIWGGQWALQRGLAEVLGIACFLSKVKLSLFCGFALGTWLRILDSVTFVCAKVC